LTPRAAAHRDDRPQVPDSWFSLDGPRFAARWGMPFRTMPRPPPLR